jgi:hypothetical protein
VGNIEHPTLRRQVPVFIELRRGKPADLENQTRKSLRLGVSRSRVSGVALKPVRVDGVFRGFRLK